MPSGVTSVTCHPSPVTHHPKYEESQQMTQSNVRRSGGRRVQQKKTNSNRTLIIAAVIGVVVLMLAAGLALSRSSSANIPGQQQFPNLVPPPTSPHIAEVTSPH